MRSVRENPEAYLRGELWWQECDVPFRSRTLQAAVARTIPINRRSVTGFYPSQKMGRMVAFESTLERDLLERLEFDFNVSRFQEQPLSIQHTSNGFEVTYIPDALVWFSSTRPPELVEVKYTEDLIRNGDIYRDRFAAATEYARSRRMSFVVRTETDIRSAYLRNAKLLLPYRRLDVPPEIAHCILTEARRTRHSFGTLLAYACARWDARLSRGAIFHLLARGCLTTNFDYELEDESEIERDHESP